MTRRQPLRRALVTLAALLLLPFHPGAAAADDGGRRVRFGIQTPNHASWDDLLATWREADTLGYDTAYLYDHLMPIFADPDGDNLEGWTALAALAAETSRIRIGILVTGNTYRNPALLAKMATTVDHISRGRLILGIGASWHEPEHEAYGFHFGTARERAERLDEALQVITRLWREDHPSFAGKYYRLERAPYAPENVQRPHPPIVIGGQGKEWIIPLVARHADGWNAVTGVTPDGIRERRRIIEEECARVGRSPCPTDVSVLIPLLAITRIPLAGPVVRLGARAVVRKEVADAVLADSPDGIKKRLRPYVDAGVNEIILNLRPPYDRDLLREFAEEIIPAFN